MAKVKTGKVISNKMQKTVVVEIVSIVVHPLYKKQMKRTKNIMAHDELGVNIGDIVKIAETKPFSKSVHFKTVEVIK